MIIKNPWWQRPTNGEQQDVGSKRTPARPPRTRTNLPRSAVASAGGEGDANEAMAKARGAGNWGKKDMATADWKNGRGGEKIRRAIRSPSVPACLPAAAWLQRAIGETDVAF